MSEGRTAAGAAHRVGAGTTRLVRAWRVLPHESRLAAFASAGLFVTLFLPWYQLHFFAVVAGRPQPASDTQTGWAAFSFVEAAVLLVAVGVLVLLFQRAEGRAFHLPGGDGGVITVAGVWTCLLIVWRIFDKQGASSQGTFVTSYGIEWGIFIALASAGFLAYSGSRIRAAHRPEPPLPGESGAPEGSNAAADVTERPRRPAPPRPGPSAPPSRRRAPRPVPADRPAESNRPVASDRPVAADGPVEASEPAPDRPRRRASAAELFERVVPDDPPTMRLSRTKPSHADPTPPGTDVPSARARPDRPIPPDEQLTMPLEADETLPFRDRDDTVRLGQDDTARLREDDTARLGQDDTLPLDRRDGR